MIERSQAVRMPVEGGGPAEADERAKVDELVASMEAQLDELYAERARLTEAFGPLTADDLIAMVESMATQLDALYAERDDSAKEDAW